MGVQGLRKLIEASGCARQLPAPTQQQNNSNNTSTQAESNNTNNTNETQLTVDHILIDMNGVIHGAFTRNEPDSKATIRNVLQSLKTLLSQIVTPRRSLILCFDGPAPFAKLNTQRQRRRKVSHMDIANNDNFSDLSITTGSVFMLELEQHVTRFLQLHSDNSKDGFLRRCANISICGTSVPGEGEAKIAQSLSRIAATTAKTENDSVVVIGNDIDLVLTCIAATSFHNIGVLNPQTFQIIDVGSFLARWVSSEDAMSVQKNPQLYQFDQQGKRVSSTDKDERSLLAVEKNVERELLHLHRSAAGFVSFTNLPGARIDFVWLFMLNGSDYYDGLGDAALSLWKQYRMLKKQRAEFRLLSKTHALITNSLRSLFQCEQIELEESAKKKKSGKRRDRDGGQNFDDFDEEADDDMKGRKDKTGEEDENERRRGSLKISSEQRHAAIGLLNASLWALITTVTGVCPNFKFRPIDPKQYEESIFVSYATMRAAIATHEEQTVSFHLPKHIQMQIREFEKEHKNREHQRYEEEAQHYSEEEMSQWIADRRRRKHLQRNFVTAQRYSVIPVPHPLAPLTPLQTYVALMPRKELLPAGVAKVFVKEPDLLDDWSKPRYDSSTLPEIVKKIFKRVSYDNLTDAEKFLTQFGEPVDVKGGFFRGHPNQGVFRKDQEGNRKYGIDFFRFGYGSKAHSSVTFPKIADDLVPGAKKMNAVSQKVKSLLSKKERLIEKIAERKKVMKKKAKIEERRGAAFTGKAKDKVEKKLAAQEKLQAAKKTKKKTDGETGVKSLYWYDVFNKSSRDSAL